MAITFNQANILTIENDGMRLDIEDDIQDGISMHLSVDRACITMVGLYINKELSPFLTQDTSDFHVKVDSSLLSQNNGNKKVLETIFSTKPFREEDTHEYKIIFYSEDTRIRFPLNQEEWEELVRYIQFISNGYEAFIPSIDR